MSRYWLSLSLLLLIITSFFMYYATGGKVLMRIIKSYLMADIPDKCYGWSDFVLNNETNKVSGFYSPQLSGEGGVAIWTLAGPCT